MFVNNLKKNLFQNDEKLYGISVESLTKTRVEVYTEFPLAFSIAKYENNKAVFLEPKINYIRLDDYFDFDPDSEDAKSKKIYVFLFRENDDTFQPDPDNFLAIKNRDDVSMGGNSSLIGYFLIVALVIIIAVLLSFCIGNKIIDKCKSKKNPFLDQNSSKSTSKKDVEEKIFEEEIREQIDDQNKDRSEKIIVTTKKVEPKTKNRFTFHNIRM